MKKGMNAIIAVIILIIIIVSSAIGLFYWLTQIQSKSLVSTSSLQDQILTSGLTSLEVVSTTVYSDVIYVDVRNTGDRTIQLLPSAVIVAIEDMGGNAVCRADSLAPGGTFETLLLEDVLRPRESTRIPIYIDTFLCNMEPGRYYYCYLNFAGGATLK